RDLRDRQLLVALRRMRDAHAGRRVGCLRLGTGLLGSRRRRLGLRLRRRGLPRRTADRLDLDLRQAAAEAGVPLVPGPPLVLADANLLAELVAHDAGGHGRRRREIGAAVAADEQDARIERLALVRLESVHEEALPLLDAVLLTADGDDRVAHRRGKRGLRGPRTGPV